MSKVDLIIPVYNVEKYIGFLLDSILAQYEKEFKCFLIDDKSTDKSGEICDEYAKIDNRITAVHNESNIGMGASRDIGYSLGDSPWVAFIDSDDLISPDFLSRLLELKSDDIEISVCNTKVVDSETKSYVNVELIDTIKTMDNKEAFYGILRDDSVDVDQVMWGKIIKRDCIDRFADVLRKKKIDMPRTYFNDFSFAPYLWYYCKKSQKTDAKLYAFRKRNDSISNRKKFTEHQRQMILALQERMIFLNNIGELEVLYRQALNCFAIAADYYFRLYHSESESGLLNNTEKTIEEFINNNRKYLKIQAVKSIHFVAVYINAMFFCKNRKVWMKTLGSLLYGKL